MGRRRPRPANPECRMANFGVPISASHLSIRRKLNETIPRFVRYVPFTRRRRNLSGIPAFTPPETKTVATAANVGAQSSPIAIAVTLLFLIRLPESRILMLQINSLTPNRLSSHSTWLNGCELAIHKVKRSFHRAVPAHQNVALAAVYNRIRRKFRCLIDHTQRERGQENKTGDPSISDKLFRARSITQRFST